MTPKKLCHTISYIGLITIVAVASPLEMHFDMIRHSEPISSETRYAQFHDTLINTSGQTVEAVFEIKTSRMPKTWSSYFCDEKTCYPPEITVETLSIAAAGRYVMKINIIGDSLVDSAKLLVSAYPAASQKEKVEQEIAFSIVRVPIGITARPNGFASQLKKSFLWMDDSSCRIEIFMQGYYTITFYSSSGRILDRFNRFYTRGQSLIGSSDHIGHQTVFYRIDHENDSYTGVCIK